MKFDAENYNDEYKVEVIQNSAIYVNKLAENYLPEIYYLIF